MANKKHSLSFKIGRFFGGLPIFGKVIFICFPVVLFWLAFFSKSEFSKNLYRSLDIIIFFIICLIIIISLIKAVISAIFKEKEPQNICPHCGTKADPEMMVKGSLLIEIILWLCFIIPGLIYSLWRLSNKISVCPKCEQPGMIGADTPRGQLLVKQFYD